MFVKNFKNKNIYFSLILLIMVFFLNYKAHAFDLKKLDVLPYDIHYQENISTDQQVLIITDFGPVVILLDNEDSYDYISNFKSIIRSGYYKKTSFYRMFNNYFIQAGDPNENRLGNANVKFPAVSPKKDNLFNDGTVALSNTNEDIYNTGSQFFITFNNPYWLNNKYVIVGKVIYGLSTLRTFFDKYTTNDVGIMNSPVPIQIFVLSDFIKSYTKFSKQLISSDLTKKHWVETAIETVHKDLITSLNTETYMDNVNLNQLSLKSLNN